MTGANDCGFEKTTAGQSLRKRVEAEAAPGDKPAADMSACEMLTLVHELRIRQVELELQNDDLRKNPGIAVDFDVRRTIHRYGMSCPAIIRLEADE